MRIIRGRTKRYIPASHENPRNPSALKKILFTYQDIIAGRMQMVNWTKLKKGTSFQPHFHEDMQEIFILISGKAKFIHGKNIYLLSKGDAFITDIKTPHEMINISARDLYYIVIGISKGQGGKTILIDKI